MIKKLAKIIKKFLCLILLFVMVGPNFATLVEKEGALFVTKAEFDSAISDYNSRLTSFEASINSKIDSQVSSYLDRNGIWSGKVQEIIDNRQSFDFIQAISNNSQSSTVVYYPQAYPFTLGGQTYYGVCFPTETGLFATYQKPANVEEIVIPNVNKSGLMVMPVLVRLMYWAEDTPNDAAIANVKAGNKTQKNGNYWLQQYYKDTNRQTSTRRNLDEYTTIDEAWLGTYFKNTIKQNYTNLCFSHDFYIYENNEIRFCENLETQTMQTNKEGTNQSELAADEDLRMWGCNFADPLISFVATFFVTRNSSIKFVLKIEMTGWETYRFIPAVQGNFMAAVVQLSGPVKVY